MNIKHIKKTCFALGLAAMVSGSSLAFEMTAETTNRGGGLPSGGPYVPPGELYDNEQTDGSTSLASQNSDGTFTARTADDFIITESCNSGQFEITRIRAQSVSQNTTLQSFDVDLFNDDGTGNAPESGINPFASVSENSQVSFGAFGATTSMFESDYLPEGVIVDTNTVYWISAYGTDSAANAVGFNAFFGASPGAAGTTANGVIIAPGAGVADWTPVDTVLGPPALAFSFAIDGVCVVNEPLIVPTLSTLNLLLLMLLSAGIAFLTIRKTQSNQ